MGVVFGTSLPDSHNGIAYASIYLFSPFPLPPHSFVLCFRLGWGSGDRLMSYVLCTMYSLLWLGLAVGGVAGRASWLVGSLLAALALGIEKNNFIIFLPHLRRMDPLL